MKFSKKIDELYFKDEKNTKVFLNLLFKGMGATGGYCSVFLINFLKNLGNIMYNLRDFQGDERYLPALREMGNFY